MLVYTTPRFDKKVRKYNLQSKIDKLRDDLEVTGINAVRALFDPFPPYWKRAQATVRLIATISRVKENLVFCLLDILEREDTSYQRFQSDPRRFGTAHLDPLWSADDLLTWMEKYKHLKVGIHKLPPLPDEMRSWLGPPYWEDTTTQNFVVYESEEWGKRFQRPEILICGVKYCEVILDIINETNTGKYNLPAWPGLKLYHRDRYHVLFSTIETMATPARRILFLFAPFNNEPSETEVNGVVEAIEPLYKLLGNKAADVATDLSPDQVTPFATRAYPAYLIADEASWLTIESEEGANLAFSPEEEEILRSISIGESTLPVFINGRAGSGKSTILFYLFADYCYRKWRENLPADPLFLTYSGRLLEVAKDRVYKILSSHHRFLVARLEITEVEGGDAKTSFEAFILRLSDFFRPFQQFLLALLPVEEGKRFKAENYISFHDFKQLYFGKSLHRVSTTVPKYKRFPQEDPRVLRLGAKKSPELCWHVIRTFIKGYHLGTYMDAQDYQEVPRQERTISEDTFKEIHETIWQQWYRSVTTEQGYWDDQDLIRKILELECYAPEYGAIFCDEAQDFTSLDFHVNAND
ncbi:ATP-binding protein [Acidobacteria bacterium AH-259-D05]|nr:ATP-binding protein [Acidobacteria bacterium AH-259-D05]